MATLGEGHSRAEGTWAVVGCRTGEHRIRFGLEKSPVVLCGPGQRASEGVEGLVRKLVTLEGSGLGKEAGRLQGAGLSPRGVGVLHLRWGRPEEDSQERGALRCLGSAVR